MVRRVAQRIGRGLTLELALAAENNGTINRETWKKALAAHPELVPLYESGKGKFLDWATLRLARSTENADLKWLLERRHAELFARPAEVSVNVNNEVNVQIPDDVVAAARKLAKDHDGK